jgi:hypothetical protein
MTPSSPVAPLSGRHHPFSPSESPSRWGVIHDALLACRLPRPSSRSQGVIIHFHPPNPHPVGASFMTPSSPVALLARRTPRPSSRSQGVIIHFHPPNPHPVGASFMTPSSPVAPLSGRHHPFSPSESPSRRGVIHDALLARRTPRPSPHSPVAPLAHRAALRAS